MMIMSKDHIGSQPLLLNDK